MSLPESVGVFRRSTRAEVQHVAAALRTETVGGVLLIVFAAAALVWANSPWAHSYFDLRQVMVGPSPLQLHLSLAQWAADGLLALFFFLAGMELKHEVVVGDLSDAAKAVVPVVAAVCGVVLPAVLFVVVVTVAGGGGTALRGWAVPTATDIAFALAVLGILGTHLPSGLRSFLLTLAVVDDLIAITIIACFYTTQLSVPALLLSLVPLAAFGVLLKRRVSHWWLLLPVALVAWGLVHASGIHATVAGVVLGLLVPVRHGARDDGAGPTLAERFDHVLRPLSAGVAVPLFAFMAAGVSVLGGGFTRAFLDPVGVAVVAGLVLGKAVGVFGGTWLTARFTRAELAEDLVWSDVLGLSLLAGIGFTVSLLLGELAYGAGSERDAHVKIAVLTGSLLAALLATVILRRRAREYRRIAAYEQSGANNCEHSDPTLRSTDGAAPRARECTVAACPGSMLLPGIS